MELEQRIWADVQSRAFYRRAKGPSGGYSVPPPKKNTFHTNGNLKTGDRKMNDREQNICVGITSFSGDSPPSRGASDPSPEGRLPTPPASGVRWRPNCFAGDTEGCRMGRAVARSRSRPRRVWRRSGEPVFCRAWYTETEELVGSFGHHRHHHVLY